MFFVELVREEGERDGPGLVGALFPIVEETSLEESTGVHFLDEMYDLVVVGDDDAVVVALDLSTIELPRERRDVGVRRVRPRREERRLDGYFFGVRNDEP